jgi:hypothetical protein
MQKELISWNTLHRSDEVVFQRCSDSIEDLSVSEEGCKFGVGVSQMRDLISCSLVNVDILGITFEKLELINTIQGKKGQSWL